MFVGMNLVPTNVAHGLSCANTMQSTMWSDMCTVHYLRDFSWTRTWFDIELASVGSRIDSHLSGGKTRFNLYHPILLYPLRRNWFAIEHCSFIMIRSAMSCSPRPSPRKIRKDQAKPVAGARHCAETSLYPLVDLGGVGFLNRMW